MPNCERCGAGVIHVELDDQPGRPVLLDSDAGTWYVLVIHQDVDQERARPVFAYHEHRCGDLAQLAELAPLSQVELDDLVHDRKGAEAAEINNDGKASQLAYLTGVRPDVVARFLEARGRPGAGR